MQFSWQVNALDADKVTGVISNVHWELLALEWVEGAEENEKELHRERVYGSIALDDTDPSAEGFVDWENVTEPQAIEWAKTALGDDEVTKIEQKVTAALELKLNPTEKNNLPWSD